MWYQQKINIRASVIILTAQLLVDLKAYKYLSEILFLWQSYSIVHSVTILDKFDFLGCYLSQTADFFVKIPLNKEHLEYNLLGPSVCQS